MRRLVAGIVGVSVVAAVACDRFKSRSAVREAIEEHLRQRPGLVIENMSMDVEDVKFSGQMAEARVKFQSKQLPQSFVEVRYTLRRSGDHWEVESSSPMSMGSPHGSMAPAPAGSAPAEPRPSH